MKRKAWSENELKILSSDLSCRDIQKLTGRSFSSIYAKRHEMGYEFDSNYEKPYDKPFAIKLTQKEKEARLYCLAEKIGVKIGV